MRAGKCTSRDVSVITVVWGVCKGCVMVWWEWNQGITVILCREEQGGKKKPSCPHLESPHLLLLYWLGMSTSSPTHPTENFRFCNPFYWKIGKSSQSLFIPEPALYPAWTSLLSRLPWEDLCFGLILPLLQEETELAQGPAWGEAALTACLRFSAQCGKGAHG